MNPMLSMGCGVEEPTGVIGNVTSDTSIDFLASLTPRFQLIMGGKAEETPYGDIPANQGFSAFIPKNLFIIIILLLIYYLIKRL